MLIVLAAKLDCDKNSSICHANAKLNARAHVYVWTHSQYVSNRNKANVTEFRRLSYPLNRIQWLKDKGNRLISMATLSNQV